MKAFQYYFKPRFSIWTRWGKEAKLRRATCFKTFSFEPSFRKEQKFGNLYLVGELKNVSAKNKEFLKNLAEIIKNEYYAMSQRTIEDAFKKSLARVNQFLERKIKRNNSDWLGNLSFLVFSLTPQPVRQAGRQNEISGRVSGKTSVIFSKIGNLKVFLFREKETFSLEENLNFNSSLIKTFPNIIKGELSQGDRILVLNQGLFEEFSKKDIFENFLEIKKVKELKKFFKEKKEILKDAFGILLFVFVKKQRKARRLFVHRPGKSLGGTERISGEVRKRKISLASFNFFPKIIPPSPLLKKSIKKSLISILILIFLLILGYLIF